MNKNNSIGIVQMIEFWVPDEELKKLKDGEDHHFAFGWDIKQEEYFLSIDGKSPRAPTAPERGARLSYADRSPAWAKVTYLSMLDELNSFGEEEVRHENE